MTPAEPARLALLLVVLGLGACQPPPPVGATVEIASAPPSPPPHSPLPPPPTLAVAAAEPSEAPLDAVRDDRAPRKMARALLATEVAGLENLVATTDKASPDRPVLIVRLAQDYAALAVVAQREHADKVVESARTKAMRYNRLLATDHPKWCRDPGDPTHARGCADEALYYLALDAERSGQLDQARRAYLDLLQAWPSFRFVPLAYLAFGEMFMAESQSDPSKLSLAEQSYQQTLKYPPGDNRAYGYALYRLGQVAERRGDDPKALHHLSKAATHAKASHDPTGLGEAARREVVVVYARVGDPAQARGFFARLALDDKEVEEMLAELARLRPAP